ncbi:LamG domain-containing protein [Streptomyces millisiae]|uniref:LamG domain-containing protein n=1 Tax=Streptomyces millisiae TaxID=3075542 RepID=A0ABU2LNP5_9ACTN|nr:LamG domain-containing protein [Streptomyces sp. DSM 44918]MDT0319206.1 LamG domain-containing protein [Streptomyces sp. DSM 44918]
MSQLSMEFGGVCAPPASPAQVRTRGQVYAADVTDADGDRVAVEFRAYWDTGDGQGNVVRWAPGLSTFNASGSGFSMTLPSGLPRDGHVQWEARSYDGAEYSPWSSTAPQERCEFVYNTSVPPTPSVTSSEYPASNPADPADPWHDGVGRYGSFTFASTDTDVVRYRYRFASGDQVGDSHDVLTSGGAPRTVRLVPDQRGDNRLYVRAVDSAGNSSAERSYVFRVGAGTPERAVWDLDEEAGTASVQGEGAPWTAALTGDAHAGAEGVLGSALRLGGESGYARTSNSVVDTSESFSVSLWARLPESGVTGTGTAISQAGNHASGFDLSVDPATGGWSFGLAASDARDAAVTRAQQDSAARVGEWTHVAGVVDASADEVLLYVDGRRVGAAPFDHETWEARGATALGARLSGRSQNEDQFFEGDLDEAQFHDYGLTADQVAGLADQRPVTTGGRPASVIWSFEESADATRISGRAQTVEATASDGVTLGAEGEHGPSARFDGATGVVAASQPVVDTAGSFAVSAWVNLPSDKADRTMVVAAQTADDGSGFALVHAPGGQGWTMRGRAAGGTVIEASQSPCPSSTPNCVAAGLGTWTHVVGVHDLDAEGLRVYVNGELAGSAPFTGAVSSTGRFTLGAVERQGDGQTDHLSGRIDDVRLFDRVATAYEVRRLAIRNSEVAGRWMFESTESGVTPDDSVRANPLILGGDASIGPGWIDYNALVLDGVDDHAFTDTIPVDTSDSFTVGVWAQAAEVASEGMTLVSGPGANNSAFRLRFEPDPEREGHGQWEAVLPAADAAGTTEVRVANSQFLDVRDWNHIVLSYDAPRRQARLYVNGHLQQLPCDDPGTDPCGRSWADGVMTYEAAGSLEVGRTGVGGSWGEHWAGSIDDLWLFQGALNDQQVAWLASSFFGTPTEVPPGA